MEEVEQFVMATSESVNEKVEEVERQMAELIVEIKANVQLVTDKKRNHAKDTRSFIRVLCDDVRQFLACMVEELTQIQLAIEERDLKCKEDFKEIEGSILHKELQRDELISNATLQQVGLSTGERKELAKLEVFREHAATMKRHMDNTDGYLRKIVRAVEAKI